MRFLAVVFRDGVAAFMLGADFFFLRKQLSDHVKELPMWLADGRLIISEQVESAAWMHYKTIFSGCAA